MRSIDADPSRFGHVFLSSAAERGAMTGTPLVHATVPVLASLDIVQSAAFYTQRLGFEQRLQLPDYLIVARDGCEIHFWRCGERHIAENTSCYVRADTRALHADFTRRGLALAPPAERDWGMRELYVTDPHGNLIKFGEPL